MMKKTANILLIIAFFAFLFAAMAATVLLPKGETSYFENRALASQPTLSRESVLSGTYFTGVENYLKDAAAGRTTLMRFHTKYELFRNVKVLKTPVVNDIVVTDDALLPLYPFDTPSDAEIAARAEAEAVNIVSVSEAARSVGAQYYYVAVPTQANYFADSYPWYLNSKSDEMEKSKAALFDRLSGTDVNIIDMGELLLAPDLRDEVAYRTDHHYTIKGAYRTYRELMRRITEDNGVSLPVMTEDQCFYTEVDRRFMGSRLRKLFGLVDIQERLGAISPFEPVDFMLTDWGSERAPQIYYPDISPDYAEYIMYMSGDISETILDTGRDELPRILIYGDSFTNAVECLIYWSFGEMRSLDLRYYTEKSLGEYIEDYKPDYVVLIRDYDSLLITDANGSGAW